MMVAPVQEGKGNPLEQHLRPGNGERDDSFDTTLTVAVPFPAGIHEKLTVSCTANGWTVEQWCRQQVLERLELLQRDEILRWETFFNDFYYEAVDRWQHSIGEVADPVPSCDDLVLERLGLLRSLLQEVKDTPSSVVVVTFSFPLTTVFHGLLTRLCSFIALPVEEWCSFVVFENFYFIMQQPGLFCQSFIDDLEDRFCGSDMTPLLVGAERLE
ncbi:MAG: hypothetical protein ACFFD4_16585 [Candidatus Odinarchaeota archaeon]